MNKDQLKREYNLGLYTTVERDALTPHEGTWIVNADTEQEEVYISGQWLVVYPPAPKRVPLPRAKIGDVVMILAGQWLVMDASYTGDYWEYRVQTPAHDRFVTFDDEHILTNLTTRIDYQEGETAEQVRDRIIMEYKVVEKSNDTTGNSYKIQMQKEECKHELQVFIADGQCKWCGKEME